MRFVHAPILYYCIPINKNEVTGNREMPMLREWLTSDFVMYLTYLSQRKYARQTLEYFANDVEYYCLNNTSEDTFYWVVLPKTFDKNWNWGHNIRASNNSVILCLSWIMFGRENPFKNYSTANLICEFALHCTTSWIFTM